MGPVQSENDMRDRIGYTECVIHVFILYTCSIQIQNCQQITEAQVETHTQNFYSPKNPRASRRILTKSQQMDYQNVF